MPTQPLFEGKGNSALNPESDRISSEFKEGPATLKLIVNGKVESTANITLKNPDRSTTDEQNPEDVLSNVEFDNQYLGWYSLTSDELKKRGLEPKHRVKVRDVIIWLSDYFIHHKRKFVIGYVIKDRRVKARTYYVSNSQCMWRYLPDYEDIGYDFGWYGKGRDEESLNVPVPLQKALSEIHNQIAIGKSFSAGIIMGTAHKIPEEVVLSVRQTGNTQEYIKNGKGDYWTETEDGITLKGIPHDSKTRPSPEELELSHDDSPDFSRLLARWKLENENYSEVTIEAFPSKNGNYIFMFCRDKLNRVWIGGIDYESPIESTGLRKYWVKTGNLTTPAYEYLVMSDDYGNEELAIKRLDGDIRYIDMYKNYLSKIPVIRDYVKARIR